MSKKQPPKKQLAGIDSRTKLHGMTTIQTEGHEVLQNSMPDLQDNAFDKANAAGLQTAQQSEQKRRDLPLPNNSDSEEEEEDGFKALANEYKTNDPSEKEVQISRINNSGVTDDIRHGAKSPLFAHLAADHESSLIHDDEEEKGEPNLLVTP